MEDCVGKKIKIGIGQTKVKKEEVDCLRVRIVSQNLLSGQKINASQSEILQDLIVKAGRTTQDWCQALKLNCVNDLPAAKYDNFFNRLTKMAEERSANNN
jgi:hypothetical protein